MRIFHSHSDILIPSFEMLLAVTTPLSILASALRRHIRYAEIPQYLVAASLINIV